MKLFLKILLPLIIIAGAILGAKKLVASRPAPPTREVKVVIPQVDTIEVKSTVHRPEVRSFGTVQAQDLARLTPELTARIVWVSNDFRVGNYVQANQVLVKLEKRDFEAALEAQIANLAQLERQFAEEKILASQAAADWIASGRSIESASDFRLRKPQIAALKAQVKSAQAAIDTAKLNLDRTDIRSPFAARVLSRNANLGEFASPQAALGQLSATDKAEVRLPFTSEQLARIDAVLAPESLAQAPLEVTLRAPEHKGSRTARIVRLDPTIDARNQVRYLIAELADPFSPTPFPLPIGSFVHATVKGRPIPQSLRFPESALVDDQFVWTVNAETKLQRLPVQRIATEDGDVIVTSSSDTQTATIVTRPLTTFRPGEPVRLKTARPAQIEAEAH